MVKVKSVTLEHHDTDLLGIGESRPRISWSFEGDDPDWFQTAYELQLECANQESKTFKVESPSSLLVPWPADDLVSGQAVTVWVRVADQKERWSEWSDPATVEAGLLSNDDWKCSLIEASIEPEDGPHRPVIFRRKFVVPAGVSEARMYMTAHGIYSATLNGKRIGDHVLAPGWTSYVSNRFVYQTFAIDSELSEGYNTLEVTVAEGWYCGKLGWRNGRYDIYGDKVGLIAMLSYLDSDGARTTIGTNEQWEWAHGSFVSAGIYDGVNYDCNETISRETEWTPVATKCINDDLVAPDGPPIRKVATVEPIDILTTPSGKTLIDFGQNMVGWVKVRVNGPKSHKITLQFAEVLDHGELGVRPLRTAKATDSLILDGKGPMEWQPEFTFHGFRYVQVNDWPGKLDKEDITAVVIHSDMKPTCTVSSSNRLLNQLHKNVVWGTKGNFVGIPTDCPQRDERLGWTGDINMFSSTANFLFDTAGLLKSWMTDLKLEQKAADGIVPLVVPNIYEAYNKDAQAVWGDVAIMLPWQMYLAFGDKQILESQYESMKIWINAIPRRENGLWNYKAEWKLADWLDPAAPPEDPGMASTDPTHVSDGFLVHITDLMVRISAIVGDTAGAKEYSTKAASLRKAYADTYIAPSGLLADNTQTALSLALAFDLFPTKSQRATAASRLEEIIRRKARFHIATGFAGTPYVGHALTSANKSNIFYRMLLSTSCPSFLYPVIMGATTIWERWDSMLPDGSINPGQMTSFNHYALGAVASWMHENILGLRIREPGWKEFDVKVSPGGNLKWAQGSHESPYGLITVRWQIKAKAEKESFWLEVRIPPNTKGHIHLPGTDKVDTRGSGLHTWEFDYQDPGDWPPESIIAPNVPVPDSELAYFDEVLPCPWDEAAGK